MGSECGTRGGAVQQHHESPPSHSHLFYELVITRALRGIHNSSKNLLICTAAVVEDRGTGSNPLMSYRPRDSMCSAVLRACGHAG